MQANKPSVRLYLMCIRLSTVNSSAMFCTPGFWGPKGPGTLTSRGLPVLHQPGKIICLGLLWFATRNLAYPNIKKIAGQFLTPSCNMGLMQASHLVNLALMLYRLWTMTLLLSAITGIHIKDRKAIEIFSYCYVYGFSRLIFKKKLLKFLLLKWWICIFPATWCNSFEFGRCLSLFSRLIHITSGSLWWKQNIIYSWQSSSSTTIEFSNYRTGGFAYSKEGKFNAVGKVWVWKSHYL